MKKWQRRPLWMLATLLLSTSCSTIDSNTKPSSEDLTELSRNVEKRSAVSGTLLVTTELNGQSVTAPGVLLVEWPDHLRLEVQDPVGGILAMLVLNGEQFWLYDSNRAEILTGPMRKLPAGMVPNISTADLVRVFLARPTMEHLRAGKLSAGRSVYQDSQRNEIFEWADSQPTKWQIHPSGRAAAAAFYEDYEFKSGLHYPTKIKLVGPGLDGKESQILLAWKDWEPSVAAGAGRFQIPQSQTFGRKVRVLP